MLVGCWSLKNMEEGSFSLHGIVYGAVSFLFLSFRNVPCFLASHPRIFRSDDTHHPFVSYLWIQEGRCQTSLGNDLLNSI